LSRLAAVAEDANKALEEYRFNEAASAIYQFIWHELCDWYLEMAKYEIRNPEHEACVRRCLLHTLDTSLRLLHPFMPFVTEEIWQSIRNGDTGIRESIMVSEYPGLLQRDFKAEEDMSHIIDAVSGIRTIRGELNISPSLNLKVSIRAFSRTVEKVLNSNVHYIKGLARTGEIEIGLDVHKPDCSAISVKSSMEIFVPLKGVLNIEAEVDRLKKERSKVEASIAALDKKLLNEDFVEKAPKEIVDKERVKYEELIVIKEKISESIKLLKDVEVKNDAQGRKRT
jgi:valyl-tRNA synthetase